MTTAVAPKTVTMTLAVFIGSGSGATWVYDRTRALADKHPSRVVLMDESQALGERHDEPAHQRGEWIEVGVRGADPRDLEATLASLALPEVPIVLLWIAEAIAEDPRFLALARRADATIVSSSVARTDERPLHDLSTFVQTHPEISIRDISYLRLAAWQELIAWFFDLPGRRDELGSLQHVEVAAGSDAEMYYILGWLFSRLGRTLPYDMVHAGPPRRLSRVALLTEHCTYAATVHSKDDNVICLAVGEEPLRYAPLHTVDLASLVERAILSRTHDRIFLASLAAARRIIDERTA